MTEQPIPLLESLHYEDQANKFVLKANRTEIHDDIAKFVSVLLSGTNNHLQSNLDNYDLNTVNMLGKKVQDFAQILNILSLIKSNNFKAEISVEFRSNLIKVIEIASREYSFLYESFRKSYEQLSNDEKKQRITEQLFPSAVLANYLLQYIEE